MAEVGKKLLTSDNSMPVNVMRLVDGGETVAVKESTAEVLFANKNEVFYNPVQEFNRDLSVAVLRLQTEDFCTGALRKKKSEGTQKFLTSDQFHDLKYGEKHEQGMRILEALAASGLRAIRYAKELKGVKAIVANDLSAHAVESIRKNVEHNSVGHLVEATCGDATMAMYKCRPYQSRFDVIDLDPYGSPVQFLDAAVQAVTDGGLLMVTCTDMAILCGNTPEKCRASYGATSLKTKSCHEWALRIVLQSLEAAANRYGRYIEPLLSLSIDFYCRLFIRIYTGQAQCKMSASKTCMVYLCSYCETTWTQPMIEIVRGLPSPHCKAPHGPPVGSKCPNCDSTLQFGGPYWTAPLHNKSFINRILDILTASQDELSDPNPSFGTKERMIGMLSVAAEELEVPGYFCLDRLASAVRVHMPKMISFRSAIMNAGYKVSLSHACSNSIKTDAPSEVIWDLMRCWERQNPCNRDKLEPGSAAAVLLSKEVKLEADFTDREDANPDSRRRGLTRFPVNPAPNWGPKTRAKAGTVGESFEKEKSVRNQGKRTLTQREKMDESGLGTDCDLKRLRIPESSEQS